MTTTDSRNVRRPADRITAFLVQENTEAGCSPAARRRARRSVAALARDADDAQTLMAALGLFDDEPFAGQ